MVIDSFITFCKKPFWSIRQSANSTSELNSGPFLKSYNWNRIKRRFKKLSKWLGWPFNIWGSISRKIRNWGRTSIPSPRRTIALILRKINPFCISNYCFWSILISSLLCTLVFFLLEFPPGGFLLIYCYRKNNFSAGNLLLL